MSNSLKTHYGFVGGFDDVPDWHIRCGLDYAENLTTKDSEVTCKRCIKAIQSDAKGGTS